MQIGSLLNLFNDVELDEKFIINGVCVIVVVVMMLTTTTTAETDGEYIGFLSLYLNMWASVKF
jgi:hypothetical protein